MSHKGSAARVARSIRDFTERAAEARDSGKFIFGTVHDTDPWEVELHDASVMLHEDDLTISRWVEQYDHWKGVDVDDTVVLVEMEDGDYVVVDVVTDGALLDFPAGAVAYVAGSGLGESPAGTFNVNTDGSTIEVSSDALRVKALGITDAHVAAANKDGVAGTASLRTLGTGAQQAAAGDHAHSIYVYTGGNGLTLTGQDFSVNVDGSTLEISGDALRVKGLGISDSHIATSAAIAISKLATTGALQVTTVMLGGDALLKRDAAGVLAARNSADSAYGEIRAQTFKVSGTTYDWTTAGTTGNRSFNADSMTVGEIAQELKALVDDLITIGILA